MSRRFTLLLVAVLSLVVGFATGRLAPRGNNPHASFVAETDQRHPYQGAIVIATDPPPGFCRGVLSDGRVSQRPPLGVLLSRARRCRMRLPSGS
jgi:hypothetical protein